MWAKMGGRWIGLLLDRLYTGFAWAYDAVSWVVSGGRWAGWRRVALRYLGGGRVLEVGCGTGHLLLELAGQGRQVCGSDPSPAMLRQVRRRVRRHAAPVHLCRARAQALPYGNASFDTLVCTFPAPYIGEPGTWAEFERVLAPGGRAVVVYGVRVGPRGLASRWIRFLLTLGGTSGVALRPAWKGCLSLRVEHIVVPEGPDRVGLLLADKRPA